MSDSDWLDVPDWWQHQHYHDPPTWIKLHTSVILTPRTRKLSFRARGVLFSVWLAHANSDFRVPNDPIFLTKALGQRVRRDDLDLLIDAGLLVVTKTPPSRERSRARAHERLKKDRGEISKEISPSKKDVAADSHEPSSDDVPKNIQTRVEFWIVNVAPLIPEDRLEDVIADEFRLDDTKLIRELAEQARRARAGAE